MAERYFLLKLTSPSKEVELPSYHDVIRKEHHQVSKIYFINQELWERRYQKKIQRLRPLVYYLEEIFEMCELLS